MDLMRSFASLRDTCREKLTLDMVILAFSGYRVKVLVGVILSSSFVLS